MKLLTMKPILFNAEMVQAILAGRKTKTRRPVGEDRRGEWSAVNDCRNHEYGADVPCYLHREICVDDYSRNIMYPKYDVGDTLYVRETWRLVDFEYIDGIWSASVEYKDGTRYARLRFGEEGADKKLGWRPSIHMPREAARLFLRVTDVRAEKLQDITEEQATVEGFAPVTDWRTGAVLLSARRLFYMEWDGIYAAKGYGWKENPWVFVYTFRQVEKT